MQNARQNLTGILSRMGYGLAVNGFFAKVLCQHVVNDSTVFCTLGFTISFDNRIDGFHQLWTISKPKFFHEEILFHSFQLSHLAARNR